MSAAITGTASAPESREVELSIRGMTCAACAARVEKKLSALDDVSAAVNFATETATVTALASVPVAWAAWPFHQAALKNARHGAASMDTLVSLGIAAACGWSVYSIFVLDRELARATLAAIRRNLAWAFGYNIAAIPLAAAGFLNPLIAGAAMAASSVFVVASSIRLRRFGTAGGTEPGEEGLPCPG